MTILKYTIVIFIVLSGFSCKKFLDVDPPDTDLSSTDVFASEATATAAVLAIYTQMESEAFPYYVIQASGISSDELINYNPLIDYADMASNNLLPANSAVFVIWNQLYRYIFQANAILEGLSASKTLKVAVRDQLKGEALFIRAFCYHYLVQYFGDLPYATGTNYETNGGLMQSAESDIYDFMKTDLLEAVGLLGEEYRSGSNAITSERVRPNRFVAMALLTRVYLLQQDWPAAETAATSIIDAGMYKLSTSLDEVFGIASEEAIWQFKNVVPQYNSFSGAFLILASAPYELSIQPTLLDAFEPNDRRRNSWIGNYTEASDTWYFPYKYKVTQGLAPITEYTMVIRLAEIYLARAEARTHQGFINTALTDINRIRNRAGLVDLPVMSANDLLDRISQERRFELVGEFGDRWFDLRRGIL